MNNKLLIKYLSFPESYINDSNYNLLKQLLVNYKDNSEGKEKELLERLFDKLSSIDDKEEFIKLLWDFDEVVYQDGTILNENGTQNKKIIAYHLSKKDFDNFSLDYIHSGLGSSLNGYGIYFTKDISMIEEYLKKLNNNEYFIYTVTLDGNIIKGDDNGWELYSELVDKNGDEKSASLDMVKKYNIDGISYYNPEDGNSFVVFNPNIIKIIKKEKVIDSKLLNESTLDLDPEELSKNREEDRELESLPFQRPNKPMSKELRELLYGKKYEPKKVEKKTIKPRKSNFEKYKSQILRYQDYLKDAEGNGEQEQLRHELFLIGKKMDKDKTLSSEEYGKLLDILYK